MNTTQGIRVAVALVVATVVAVLAAGYVVWWLQQAPTLVGEAERASATQRAFTESARSASAPSPKAGASGLGREIRRRSS